LPLYQGFIDEENQITCYTDHQILNAIINSILKQLFEKTEYHFKKLTTLSVGDYVTHIDHGIGRFGGLQKIQVENKTQEAIKLVYADNIVYVSIHSLHKISKYTGKDGTPPKI
jgi:transcription-repair coupling factor (superfamily II helicase)